MNYDLHRDGVANAAAAAAGDDARARERDAERTLWLRERERGEANVRRGALLIVSVPFVFVLTIAAIAILQSFLPIMLGLSYVVIGGFSGVIVAVHGTVRSARAKKKLRTLDAETQLPVARLLRG